MHKIAINYLLSAFFYAITSVISMLLLLLLLTSAITLKNLTTLFWTSFYQIKVITKTT